MIDNPEGTDTENSEPLSLAEATALYAPKLDSQGFDKPDQHPSDLPPPETVKEADPDDDEDTDPDAAVPDEEEPEDDVEDPDEEEADEEEAPDDGPAEYDPDAKVRLKDGRVITAEEASQEGMRLSDYRAKTEEVARERETVHKDRETLSQQVTKLQSDLQFMQHIAKAFVPQRPSPAMLDPQAKEYNPNLYHRIDAAYKQQMEMLGNLEGKFKEVEDQANAQAEEALNQHRAAEQSKLLERLPALKDEKRQERFWKDVDRVSDHYGFTREEVNALVDHRDILVLNDAMKWQNHLRKQRIANLKSTGKPAIKSLRGGQRQSAGEMAQRDYQSKKARLDKTHSFRDGLSALIAVEKARSG